MRLPLSSGLFSSAVFAAVVCLASPSHARAQDSADDQYQFIAGLCEKQHFDLAVKEARAFLEHFPTHAKADLARYRLASALYELKRFDEARAEYATLSKLGKFEFAAEVAFRLGQCELSLQHAPQAAAAFERVLAMHADYLTLPATFFLGEARFRQGDFAAAEKAYSEVAGNPPRDKKQAESEYVHDAAYGLCWCAFRLGHNDEAVQRIERFLARFQGDAATGELRFLSGEAHLAAGRAQQALDAYSAVRDGNFVEPALRGAAFAAAQLGDHRGAAQRFGDLLERYPQGEHAGEAALHRGIELLRANDAPGAVQALASPHVEPTSEALYWRAQAQLSAGDANAALASVDAALGAKPAKDLAERLNVTRGDVLAALGRSDEAARSYARSDSDYALYAAAVAAHNAGRNDDASRLAHSLLDKYPQSSYGTEMRLVLGEGALAAKDYPEAEAAFRAVLDAKPEPPLQARALSRSAWCRYLQDDFAAAGQLFARLIKQRADVPEADEAQYMLGLCAEKSNDARGASAAWRRYIEQSAQGSHRADALLGLSRVDQGEDSGRWLEQLLAENPDSAAAAPALFGVAEQLAHADQRAPAIERYRELLQRFPQHEFAPAARYGLGWCLYQDGQFDAASREFAQLAVSDPLDAKLKVASLELLVWSRSKLKDVDGTAAAYRDFAASGADDKRAFAAVRIAGKLLAENGRAPEAQALYDNLLRRARDRGVIAGLLVEGAWLALDAKKVDEAEAAVRTAIKYGNDAASKPSIAEASFFVGEARFEAGDDARAVELYRFAADNGAADVAARAQYKQGFACLRRDDFDGASKCFAALVEQHKDHELYGEGLYLLGEAQFRAGRFGDAVAAFTRLKSELPQHASMNKALFRLGVAQGQLGHWKECESALAELARRSSDFENAAEADLWRGKALAQRGDARGSRAAFERVLAKDHGQLAARARLEVGRLAQAAGDHEQALSEFLKVALLFADGEEVCEALYLAGGELEQLGQVDKAKERYVELTDQHAKSPFAAKARERLQQLAAK
jgi:TolA-binding protein